MKYAVIGTSNITEEFIMGARLVDGLELEGVCSRSYVKGKAFADKFGAKRVFIDLADLARNPDIDAIYVASPNSLHFEQCRMMLEAGKHVICEKPITVTPAQFEKLATLAEKNGRVYMEAIMYMHLPARELLKNALSEIGKITTAHFDFSQLSSKYPAFQRGETPNIFNPAFATGCLMDLGIYCVYPALDLFGLPKKISATAGFLSSGADSCGTAVLCYPELTVTMTYSKVAQDFCGSQILGDGGTLTIGSISQLNEVFLCRKGEEKTRLCGTTEKHILMSGEAQAFYNFIVNPAENAAVYKRCTATAFAVSRVMEEIRAQAGISFTV